MASPGAGAARQLTATARFGDRVVGGGAPMLIVAEVGVNHNGERDLALRHVKAAVDAGADAVKIQTFRADQLTTAWAPPAEYQRQGAGEISQREMLAGLELDETSTEEVLREGKRLGVVAFSTPFDVESVRALTRMGAKWMKIASGEVNNLDLLRAVGESHLPTMLSTGMSTLEEVRAAVETVVSAGCPSLVILHCVSSYPAPLDQMNLRAIQTLGDVFSWPVGLSDHSLGRDAAIAALAMGASVLEKHFTIDRSLPGPDHAMSMEPNEFAEMVQVIRQLEGGGLGDGKKRPMPAELPIRKIARRSIVAARALSRGTIVAREHLALKRPEGGLPPTEIESVVGRKLRRALAADEVITLADLE